MACLKALLGPLLFLLYTAELFDVIAHSGLTGHSYADNKKCSALVASSLKIIGKEFPDLL